jgi:pyruvate ferredoxin oxidoreductase beta subunit
VRDALDLLIARGRMPAQDDLTAVVLAGDGSSYGMGLSATSAAIERGLDFLYVCYDNEGYGNTGQQSSAATPLGARTATSTAHPCAKKDLFAIWTAHRPAYAATVIAAEPLDLARKIEKAMHIKGPRLILALAPCPTGWDYDAKDTVGIGRLAVKTGIWPLKEYEDGRLTHSRIPHPRQPVEDYLRTQGRYAHLFEPRRNDEMLERIQAEIDAYWREVA